MRRLVVFAVTMLVASVLRSAPGVSQNPRDTDGTVPQCVSSLNDWDSDGHPSFAVDCGEGPEPVLLSAFDCDDQDPAAWQKVPNLLPDCDMDGLAESDTPQAMCVGEDILKPRAYPTSVPLPPIDGGFQVVMYFLGPDGRYFADAKTVWRDEEDRIIVDQDAQCILGR